jgi:hypothetical protein
VKDKNYYAFADRERDLNGSNSLLSIFKAILEGFRVRRQGTLTLI